jgi:homoserine kinase
MLSRRYVKVRVPASTSNLGPGFDTIGLALKIYNTITVEPSSRGVHITASGEGNNELSKIEDSMVLKAMRATFRSLGVPDCECEKIHINIENEVPISRGLGGSATAIIGGVLLAAEMCNRKLSYGEILEIALPIDDSHPDNVTPSLVGGLTVSMIENEKVHFLKVPVPSKLNCIVSIPKTGLSTQLARQILPDKVPLKDAVFNLQSIALLLASFVSNNLEALPLAMQDRLHQPYRTALFPQMQDIFKSALEAGADGVALSGAGSSVIAFVEDRNTIERVTSSMQKTLEANEIDGVTIVTDIDFKGAQILVSES